MNGSLAQALLFFFCLCSHGMQVGGNLTMGESDDQQVFIDLFRQARPWQTKNADGSGAYNTELAGAMPASPDGWPLRVPFDAPGAPPQRPHTVIGARGAGDYRLSFQGKGRISFAADEGLIDATSPFLRSVTFAGTGGSNNFLLTLHKQSSQLIFVDILESDAADPIRNVRLLPPGTITEDGPSGQFLPSFLDSIRNFTALRFMDMGHVNASPLERWDQRPTTNTYSQLTAGGMAYEFMIDLANRAERDAWICVPHRVDDNFVRELARLARAKLSPRLKLFVEFSNETWNFSPGFDQSFELDEIAGVLGLSADEYYAQRSAEIWGLFEDEFGPTDAANRLIKVLASQAGRPSLSATRLEALLRPALNPRNIKPDALAIAPYFGSAVADAIAEAGQSSTVTVDEILDAAAASLRGEVTDWTRQQAAIGAQHDVWLINYEAGQHLAATGPRLSDDVLTAKLIEANRSPRMKDLYKEYLSQQRRDGALLTLLYFHTGAPSRFGSWGLLEHLRQSSADAPKWTAFREWVNENPPANVPPRAEAGGDRNLLAEPGASSASVTLDATASRDLDGSLSTFQWRLNGELLGASPTLRTNLPLGAHLVELAAIDSDGATSTDAALITVAPASAAQQLLEVRFIGSDPAFRLPWTNTTLLGPNISWTGLRASSAVNLAAGNDALHFWVSGEGEGLIQTLSNSIAANEFFSFTIAPTPPAALDLRGAILSLDWERLSGHAPRQWALFSSIDGFQLGEELAISETTEFFEEPLRFEAVLPFEGWSGLVSAVEFRLVPFGERFHGHEAAIKAISLNGAATIERPVLAIKLLGDGGLELSWPDGPHQLLESDALKPLSEWQPTSAPSTVMNGRRVVRVPAASARQFYILKG